MCRRGNDYNMPALHLGNLRSCLASGGRLEIDGGNPYSGRRGWIYRHIHIILLRGQRHQMLWLYWAAYTCVCVYVCQFTSGYIILVTKCIVGEYVNSPEL